METISLVVSDLAAVTACRRFSDEFNMLVEPACGAALSYLYCPQEIASPGAAAAAAVQVTENTESAYGTKEADAVREETVVVIAYGGSVVNLELLAKWCADPGIASEHP